MASIDVEQAETQLNQAAEDSDTQQKQQPEPEKSQGKGNDDETTTQAKAGTSASEINQMEIQPAPAFVGLGKEDLLVLANRPFWVRLRWALFIAFWLMWFGLLVAAALIIALSPGCEKEANVILPSSVSQLRR